MVEKFVRLGYLTKGIIYGLIGLLAAIAAFTTEGKATGSSGMLKTIAAQPFGKILLVGICIGLLGYALWRFIETFLDPENKGSDAKGIGNRIGYLSSGLAYCSLAFQAGWLVLGRGGGGSGDSAEDWTAYVLEKPFGRWLVGLGGAIAIGVGLYMFYQAYKTKFRKRLNLSELHPNQAKWIVQVCRFGVAARGFVFSTIGFFLLEAAYQYDPEKARSLDGILHTVARQPFGKFLLALVALGLVAYGIYMIVQARYRRLHLEQVESF
ncbi:MAG: DUF1206 domain-containing protein [Cyanobacteriota bacterium]|nr:DUF1206 domain-containing protein [Cyanobacteriota bacterium]